jgi:hypothetical protein
VDADSQLASFETTLAGALRDGYTGIRVAADNTSMVKDPERLAAWLGWEERAEAFMDTNPVTGLCGFDVRRTGAETLQTLEGIHRVRAPQGRTAERAPD